MSPVRSFTIPTVMKHGIGAIESLAAEAKALGMKRPLVVTDPGIVRYVSSGRTDAGQRFLVMEWLEGVDLRAALDGILGRDE